ncbi:uncharacterized protein LOC122076721 [Macadamia integrifolia]|uniref:uncharacterized protein LOC122076721 n=1 Tax=Macadamia integrifolia TaxID=60698 RepID=UPI001C4FDDFF|nr:uncharacterized protein LOC122076721 [Macadamia integrifolia]
MDTTCKKQPKTKSKTTTLKKPFFFFSSPQAQDPIVPSSTLNKITSHYSKWNPNQTQLQRPRPPATATDPPPPRVDTHLQAKAMTLSANADSSSLSLLKNNHRHHRYHQEQRQQVDMEKKQSKTEKGKERDKVIEPRERDEPRRSSVSLHSSRRKSFSDSQMELGEFFSTVGVKVVAVDMPPFMQIHAVTCARKTYDGLDKCSSKILASTLKKEFDGVYGPAWHCIVGTSFGSFVTHSVGGFLYFSMNHHKLYILLFKTTVQKAD